MCAQRRLRSAWASAQSDQGLLSALNGYLRTQAFFMQTAKTLIRLGRCSGWSESSLGAHAVLTWGGSNVDIQVESKQFPKWGTSNHNTVLNKKRNVTCILLQSLAKLQFFHRLIHTSVSNKTSYHRMYELFFPFHQFPQIYPLDWKHVMHMCKKNNF